MTLYRSLTFDHKPGEETLHCYLIIEGLNKQELELSNYGHCVEVLLVRKLFS